MALELAMEEASPYRILCVYNIYIYIHVYTCRCYPAYIGRSRIESKGSCFLFVASLINRIHLSQACSVSAAGLATDRATGHSFHQRQRKQIWICICDSANHCMLGLCTKVHKTPTCFFRALFFTYASLMLHLCFTCASLMLHLCFTYALSAL